MRKNRSVPCCYHPKKSRRRALHQISEQVLWAQRRAGDALGFSQGNLSHGHMHTFWKALCICLWKDLLYGRSTFPWTVFTIFRVRPKHESREKETIYPWHESSMEERQFHEIRPCNGWQRRTLGMLRRSGKCLCRERYLTMSCGMIGFPAGRLQWDTTPPASMTHAAGGSLSNAPWNNISSITYRQKHRFHGADVINFLRHFQKRLTRIICY